MNSLCVSLSIFFDRIGESHAGSSVSAVGEIRKDHVNEMRDAFLTARVSRIIP